MASCLVAASLPPRASLASGPGDEAAARALFAEGRRLAGSGDYAAACSRFEESLRLDPGIGTAFNLADCWEHVGRNASAWARFLAVAAAARAAGQPERERVARERATLLEPTLSHLIVEVSAPCQGLTVQRDAIPLGRASWGLAVPVDPGTHLVHAGAPGKKPFSATVTVASSGATVTVAIAPLEDAPAAASGAPMGPAAAISLAPSTGPAVPPAEETGRHRHLTAPVIALGALGIAASATATIFGVQFQSVNGDARKLCPMNVCTPQEKTSHDQLLSEARRDLNLAYAGAAVGGVALLTAALLWWRSGPPASPSRVARLSTTANLSAWTDGTGAELAFRW